MKKRFLAFLIVIPSLLASCQNHEDNSSSPGKASSMSSSFDDQEESDLSIKTLMGRDFTRYAEDPNAKYEVDRYFGCYNGYYAAGYRMVSYRQPNAAVKNGWMVVTDNYYDEVAIQNPNAGYGYWVPHYLWKDRAIVTIAEALEEGGISMGDVLAMKLSNRKQWGEADLDYPMPDWSEIDRPYGEASSTQTVNRSADLGSPMTLREKICAEYALRHASFIDRYLSGLSGQKLVDESKKPKTWVERYLGMIGDYHLLEMGILGHPISYDAEAGGQDAFLYNSERGLWPYPTGDRKDEFVPINYPLVLYSDGEFYGFALSVLSNSSRNPAIIFGKVCPFKENEYSKWLEESEFDDSVLDKAFD